MKVLALLYVDEDASGSVPEGDRGDCHGQYRAFGEAARAKIVGGGELAPTASATTVRVRDGEALVSDGPFADTGEAIAGFVLFDVDSLDEAAELAAQIPAAAHGAVELRPSAQREGS